MNDLQNTGTDTQLIKVELGCGKNKTPGYIGVDRFPLPGVDVVANLNERFPFEDDSIDVILAQHSLEHLDDLYHVMSEIYRVCKDGAIVFVLGPYSHLSGNRANIYHKLVFNEHTFRFFSTEIVNPYVNEDDLYIPHNPVWGLGQSDNSNMNMEFHQVWMEFFYFKQYRFLSDEQKRHARQAFQNVCDQIFYILVVDKTGHMPAEKICEVAEKAKTMEPPFISILREREKLIEPGTSILDDIEEMTNSKINKLSSSINNRLDCLGDMDRHLMTLDTRFDGTTRCLRELLLAKEQCNWRRRLHLFNKNEDLRIPLQTSQPHFMEFLAAKQADYHPNSVLQQSQVLPFTHYLEYPVYGEGEHVHFWANGLLGSRYISEIVSDGKILVNCLCTLEHEGEIDITIPHQAGTVFIRFQAATQGDIVRVLEICNRHIGVFSKTVLAAFLV